MWLRGAVLPFFHACSFCVLFLKDLFFALVIMPQVTFNFLQNVTSLSLNAPHTAFSYNAKRRNWRRTKLNL